MVKIIFYLISAISLLLIAIIAPFWHDILYLLILVIPYIAIGIYDLNSTHNVLRLYPVIGHLRYMFEFIRPEIQQYFVNTNLSGRPYNREQRDLIYRRAKKVRDTMPFGTQRDITDIGYDIAYHSLSPKKVSKEHTRVMVGGQFCKQPYNASRLNISAMSFGAISATAVLAMNKGAKLGNFAHNTGEGGLSDHHLAGGGDIIWQLGTAYFGCRKPDGNFDPDLFKQKANLDVVKMIEIKLSQGAKPSHGGVLPGVKVSEEIARIRGIPVGETCYSPAAHSSFSTPEGLLEFITQLRELCGSKPVGFKLCIGKKSDFMGICKAMLKTGVTPDFITVDGAEGGTGAAPVEYSNRLGMPGNEAVVFVESCLRGTNLRDKIKLITSAKISSGFNMLSKIALGADMCNVARPMMFAVGCIQALRCNTDTCPTGVTTQDPRRIKAIDVEEKKFHVANYHEMTMDSFLDLTGAIGLSSPDDAGPEHIYRRVSDHVVKNYDEIYHYAVPGSFLDGTINPQFADDWEAASAEQF